MTFEFTPEEANYIFQALAARPFGEVAALIQKFQAQAQTQNQQPVVEEVQTEDKKS